MDHYRSKNATRPSTQEIHLMVILLLICNIEEMTEKVGVDLYVSEAY
jgi:hypothetical protein